MDFTETLWRRNRSDLVIGRWGLGVRGNSQRPLGIETMRRNEFGRETGLSGRTF